MAVNTTGQFITIHGNNLYYEFYNGYKNRPVLVFLHDSLGCTQLWRDFPYELANAVQCNVLIYDRLGYGKSDGMPTAQRPVNYLEHEADVLNIIITTLHIDNAVLFGHSDGGSIALITAAKYPERVKALICEAAHIFVEDVTLKGIIAAIQAYKNTDLAIRLKKYHGDKVETLFKAWTDTWTRPDFKNWNIENFLPAITCPLLFIQGKADEYGSLHQAEKTIHQVKGPAQKLIIPGVGHTPHREAADVVLIGASEFINAILIASGLD